MYKLFLDTAYKTLRIGLLDDKDLLTYEEIDADRQFTELTVPTLMRILKKHQLHPKDIDEFYVTIGPGSFTGSRIGLTIAKTWHVLNPEMDVYYCDNLLLQIHGKENISLIDARGKKDYYLDNGEYGICKTGELISIHRNFQNYHFRPTDLNWFKKADDPKLLTPFYIKKAIENGK